jgi:4-hydroxy-3-polyprenylbenzoate decarboxylase
MTDRLVVGITGASGAVYGIRLLECLRALPVEVHLIISRWARVTIEHETSYTYSQVKDLADEVHGENDQAAAISSGSFPTRGMIIAPCSTKTLAAVASGYSHNLIGRAADVTLKERRPLVLVPRESPLSAIHLENMLRLTRAGAVVLPASPGFYHRPASIAELVDFIVARVLDQLGIENTLAPRWGEGGADSRC